jgi:hypothetical protein
MLDGCSVCSACHRRFVCLQTLLHVDPHSILLYLAHPFTVTLWNTDKEGLMTQYSSVGWVANLKLCVKQANLRAAIQ